MQRDISSYYDDLIRDSQLYSLYGEGTYTVDGKECVVTLRNLKKQLYLCLMSVNALEAIRFYVSFACSFAFAERQLMEGNAKIIKFIARDEALHLTGTQHILNIMAAGQDDPEMAEIAEECKQEAYDLFLAAAEQEKRMGGLLVQRWVNDWFEQKTFWCNTWNISRISVCKRSVFHCHLVRVLTQFHGLTHGLFLTTYKWRHKKWR